MQIFYHKEDQNAYQKVMIEINTGWQFQMNSLKHVAKHGEPEKLDKQHFEEVQNEIERNLNL